VQRALDAGPVVTGEHANALDDELQVILADLTLAQHQLPVHKTGLRQPAQVQDDFQQAIALIGFPQRLFDGWRQDLEQGIQVIRNSSLLHTF